MKVSVIIPVFNGADFIFETLESVRFQVLNDWECIIVNDGSTDDTASVVRQTIGEDPRFQYVYQKNSGLSAARNTGLEHASGEYVQFLDADDVLLPCKLSEQLRTMIEALATVSYTDYRTGSASDIYSDETFYKPPRLPAGDPLLGLISNWESKMVIPPHSWLFHASLFRESGLRFDTTLPNHEDFDCWVNIFRLRPKIAFLDKKLVIYRMTEGSMSRNMVKMGDGFLQVLDNQQKKANQPGSVKQALNRKKRETLRRYNRFDRMTAVDKLLSFRHLFQYYKNRILAKSE